MAWPILAAAAMAGASGLQAHQQNKQRKSDLLRKAETQRMSPWSGMDPSSVAITPGKSMLGSIVGGAAGGYSLGSSLGGGASPAMGVTDAESVKALDTAQASGKLHNTANFQPWLQRYDPSNMRA